VRAAAGRALGLRVPELDASGYATAGGRTPTIGKGVAADAQRALAEARVGAERPLPEGVADHDAARAAGHAPLLGREGSAACAARTPSTSKNSRETAATRARAGSSAPSTVTSPTQ
jgi:hypothetical protein